MNSLKHLRRYFVPGKHNQYKPHFFRGQAVLATAGVITLLFAVSLALNTLVIRSGSSELAAVVSSTLVDLTNVDRENNKLQELTVSPVLQKAAQMKADDMAAKGYFAHNSPEGLTPWHWFQEAGYNFSFAGENLAVYFSDSVELEKAWMNSPLHRANILGSSFTEIGIATAKGVYQGRETVYVVQEFGRPSRRASSSTITNTVAVPSEKVSAPTATNKIVLAGVKKEAPIVKGEATASDPLEITTKENTFIAIKSGEESEESTGTSVELAGNPALGTVAFAGTSAPTILKVAASPQTLLRTLYGILAALIGFALILMIGVEVKRQHPLHIAYGVSLLVFMGFLLFSWQGFFFGKLLVI